MLLTLTRLWPAADCTIGRLLINGEHECFTLEDPVRVGDIFAVKVAGATAIPAGRYGVVMTYSTRFRRELPLLVDVPNFTGIRIHAGNRASDTEGCILVGTTRLTDRVLHSVDALIALLPKLRAGLAEGVVEIDIIDAGTVVA